MQKTIRGIVRGRTIELENDPGVEEGRSVQVTIREAKDSPSWGEGIRRSAGAWAGDPEIDQVMQEIQQDRRRERRPQVEP